MDNTIILVINTMIQNSDKIGNVFVTPGNPNEFFFVYNLKHVWSILLTGVKDDFLLFYYKGSRPIKELAEDTNRFNNSINYSALDYKTKEAIESFRDLFLLVKSKTYGMDWVFKDILNS
jgi:hypothetical protein